MGKYWFKHDHGARNDPKLQRVLIKLGHEGKSVFWDLLEMLYENDGYLLLSECDAHAFALRTSKECLESLVKDFQLFNNDGEKFWNRRILEHIGDVQRKSELARNAVNKRHQSKKADSKNHTDVKENDTSALRLYYGRNTTVIQEYRIENIEKEKENNSPLPPEGEAPVLSLDSQNDEQVEAGAKKPLTKPLEFPSPEFEAIWREWTEYKRVEKRKGYKSALAEQKGVTHLVNLSGGIVAHARQIVDQSMAQNWEGLFELKTPFVAVRTDTEKSHQETFEEIKARVKYVR